MGYSVIWLGDCRQTKLQCTVSDKNSWDTSTQHGFSLLARLLVLPMLAIAPNLARQHWEGKKTAKCLNNFD